MTEDIRFAFRQLRKSLGFAAIAVITLGLGIGAAAAIFGLIQGALLSPPPYADPDRLVTTAGSYTASATQTSGAWIAQLVAFRAAGQ